jgi:hypothetical protein
MMGFTQRENKKLFNFTSKKPNDLRASQPKSFIGSNNNFETFLKNKDYMKKFSNINSFHKVMFRIFIEKY